MEDGFDIYGNYILPAVTGVKNAAVSLFAPSDTAPGDYTSRLADIARQQKLAEALSQMGQQEQAVSTAGGITAPMSPMGALARGLTSFGGAYLSGKAAQDAINLEKTGNENFIKSLGNYYVDPGTPETKIPEANLKLDMPNTPSPVFDRAAGALVPGNPEAAGTTPTNFSIPAIGLGDGTPSHTRTLDERMAYDLANMSGGNQAQSTHFATQYAADAAKSQEMNQLKPQVAAVMAQTGVPDTITSALTAAVSSSDPDATKSILKEWQSKGTAQVTAAPKLNPMEQARYNAMINSGLSPQAYDAQGEAAKEKAELPFKVQLARDAAAARLDAQTNLIASNPDAISLGADYFIAKGGVYPPNARTPALQLAISNLAKQRMAEAGVSMNDLVNKGITIKATTGAAVSMAQSQAQTAVNEGTVNNSINIVKRLLPIAASKGDFTDINQFGQFLSRKTNDPNAVLLKNGIDAISGEYARVTTGVTGGTPASDASRAEAGNRILLGYNNGTMGAVIDQLQQEMAGRSNSQGNVLGDLTGGQYKAPRVPFSPAPGGAGGAAAPGAGGNAIPRISSAADYNALAKGTTYIDPQGHTRTKPSRTKP